MVISENNPLAIIGGTFNPVHFGHLRTAIELLDAFDLEQVALMPCYQPVHRELSMLDADHRLNMLQLAVADMPQIGIDDRELRRKGPSYSIDTLAEIRDESGPDRPIYFVMGSDAFNSIQTWKNWKILLDFSNLVVVNRPGARLDWQNDYFRQRLSMFDGHNASAGQLFELSVSALAISSTKIRQLTHNHQPIHYLLPETVRCYIDRHQLYQSNL